MEKVFTHLQSIKLTLWLCIARIGMLKFVSRPNPAYYFQNIQNSLCCLTVLLSYIQNFFKQKWNTEIQLHHRKSDWFEVAGGVLLLFVFTTEMLSVLRSSAKVNLGHMWINMSNYTVATERLALFCSWWSTVNLTFRDCDSFSAQLVLWAEGESLDCATAPYGK